MPSYPFFVPKPPGSFFPPQYPPSDPPFGGTGVLGGTGYAGSPTPPMYLQGNANGYAGPGASTPSAQASIYGLPFSIASAMGRAIWGQGAPYVGMGAPLPIGAQPPTVAGAAAPFNPNVLGRAAAGQGNALAPFNPYAALNNGAQGIYDWLNQQGNASLGPLTPAAISGGPIEWDKAPGYNWYQQPLVANAAVSGQTGAAGGAGPSNPWWNFGGRAPTPPAPAAPAAGSTGFRPFNPLANWQSNMQSNPLFGARPAPNNVPYGSTANNPQGAGENNPNEPGPMSNQYNSTAINAARPPGTGTGTGTGTAQPQGDMWVDASGRKHHRDYHINLAYERLDSRLGDGFTDQFISRMGVDPIRFYMREFVDDPRAAGWQLPDERGKQGRDFLTGMAAYKAETMAKFHPGAVAEWQRLHGNTEIPREQWERWDKIAMATGGNPMNVGVGENPWGVY